MSSLRISINGIILLMLTLFSLNVLDLSGILIASSIAVFVLFGVSRIRIDRNILILGAFSATYYLSIILYEGLSLDGLMKYAIIPWGCYLVGFHLPVLNRSFSVTRFIMLLCSGFFLHGFLNLISSIQIYGMDFNNPFRVAYDFWQNRQISVTTAALYYTPATIMGIATLTTSSSAKDKLWSCICIAIAVFATLLYQNRTLLMIMAIIGCMSVVLTLKNKEIEIETKIRILICITFFVALILIALRINLGGIRSIITNSRLYQRVTGEGQIRTDTWISFLFGEAWKYPLGGNQAVLYKNQQYVHNLWLDVFRHAGIFPFAMLVLFSLRVLFKLRKFVKVVACEEKENGQVIILFLLGMALMFALEPIIEANPYVFYFIILICGTIFGKCSISK